MLSSVNPRLLAFLNSDEAEVVIRPAEEAAVDEMWSGAALGRAAMSSKDDHDRDGYYVLTQLKLRE